MLRSWHAIAVCVRVASRSMSYRVVFSTMWCDRDKFKPSEVFYRTQRRNKHSIHYKARYSYPTFTFTVNIAEVLLQCETMDQESKTCSTKHLNCIYLNTNAKCLLIQIGHIFIKTLSCLLVRKKTVACSPSQPNGSKCFYQRRSWPYTHLRSVLQQHMRTWTTKKLQISAVYKHGVFLLTHPWTWWLWWRPNDRKPSAPDYSCSPCRRYEWVDHDLLKPTDTNLKKSRNETNTTCTGPMERAFAMPGFYFICFT